jgi:hypothetical protein
MKNIESRIAFKGTIDINQHQMRVIIILILNDENSTKVYS